MFVIILLVSAVATVYGQERHGTETGTAQLSIYKLPPLERAIRCTKYYEGWHGEKKHWPYVGWGHKVLPGESFTNDITKAQGDSILRADMMKLCRLFSRFGRDSLILSEISDNRREAFPKIGEILPIFLYIQKYPKIELTANQCFNIQQFYDFFIQRLKDQSVYRDKMISSILQALIYYITGLLINSDKREKRREKKNC